MRLYAKIKWGAISHNITVYYRQSETSVIADKNRDVSGDVAGVLESFAEFAKTAAPEGEKYTLFIKRYAYMFLRLYWKKPSIKRGPTLEGNRRDTGAAFIASYGACPQRCGV